MEDQNLREAVTALIQERLRKTIDEIQHDVVIALRVTDATSIGCGADQLVAEGLVREFHRFKKNS